MLRQLIAPALGIAALCVSSTALAADPPVTPEVEAEAEAESSSVVVLNSEVAAGAGVSASTEGMAVSNGDFAGRLGVGAARTIAGLNGINVRYNISDNFHIGLNLGVATFSYRYTDPTNDPADCVDQRAAACDKKTRTVAYIGTSIEAMYWVRGRPAGAMPFRADFGVGGRLGFQHAVNSADVPNNLDDPLQFTAEIPLALALNLGHNFSIIPEFGAAFRWNPGTRLANEDGEIDANPGFDDPNGKIPAAETSGPGFGFEIGDHVGLFGGATLLYTF